MWAGWLHLVLVHRVGGRTDDMDTGIGSALYTPWHSRFPLF